MRKIIFFLIISLFIFSTNSFGQNNKYTDAWGYNNHKEYDKAKEAIDAASRHEATMNEPKTWLLRGKIYESLAKDPNPAYKNLSSDPAGEAAFSFQKSMELDIKKKYSEDH